MDAHYLAAKGKITREWGAKNHQVCSQYSLDTMNKLVISSDTCCVSRFHQPRGVMPLSDSTNHNDHDYAGPPGYKLEVITFDLRTTDG